MINDYDYFLFFSYVYLICWFIDYWIDILFLYHWYLDIYLRIILYYGIYDIILIFSIVDSIILFIFNIDNWFIHSFKFWFWSFILINRGLIIPRSLKFCPYWINSRNPIMINFGFIQPGLNQILIRDMRISRIRDGIKKAFRRYIIYLRLIIFYKDWWFLSFEKGIGNLISWFPFLSIYRGISIY